MDDGRHITHRHADGGLYAYIGEQAGKHPDTGDWVDGVCYQGLDGKYRWTDNVRWAERFEALPPAKAVSQKTAEILDDGETVCTIVVSAFDVGDFRQMVVNARPGPGANNVITREFLSWLKQVMTAVADSATEGLHIRDYDFPDLIGDVNAFHAKFEHGQENYGVPKVLAPDFNDFRVKFHAEETNEYADEYPKLVDAVARGDQRDILNGLEMQLDALVDGVWVLLGTADVQFGKATFHEAWKRVVRANMAKVRADRADDGATDSGRNKKFDIVKPAGWSPPDHRDLVQGYMVLIPADEAQAAE